MLGVNLHQFGTYNTKFIHQELMLIIYYKFSSITLKLKNVDRIRVSHSFKHSNHMNKSRVHGTISESWKTQLKVWLFIVGDGKAIGEVLPLASSPPVFQVSTLESIFWKVVRRLVRAPLPSRSFPSVSQLLTIWSQSLTRLLSEFCQIAGFTYTGYSSVHRAAQ